MIFIEQLHQILAKNYGDLDFDYGRLCEQFGLSRSQVYRLFKEEGLDSPSTYLRQFRMEKARILLLETDLRIQEIALDVGFKTPSHFSTRFIETYGLSPKMYRIENKK